MNEAIKRTNQLLRVGQVLINPCYLENEYADKATDEIKSGRTDKSQQLSPAAQQELSMRGCRTAFLQFHRFIYSLSGSEINQLAEGIKQYVTEQKLSESNFVYIDQRILKDTIDFHLCLRSDDNFCIGTLSDIVNDYRQNQALANDFPKITSDHLIDFAKRLLSRKQKHIVATVINDGDEDGHPGRWAHNHVRVQFYRPG